MDPELALDVMAFRLAQREVLDRHMASAVDTTMAQAVEREAFMESARNKATDRAWVRRFHNRRRLVGPTFEDGNIWPPVLPLVNVDLGDSFSGNELIYLPHGSCYVDEMRPVGPTTEEEKRQPQVFPPTNGYLSEDFAGNELIYLPHGSSYIDDMIMV
uniref:Uncharacterized protein n=1 Tax=Avena sativa TaxID=4498 RepID=A0ACD5ZCR9_AVESA